MCRVAVTETGGGKCATLKSSYLHPPPSPSLPPPPPPVLLLLLLLVRGSIF